MSYQSMPVNYERIVTDVPFYLYLLFYVLKGEWVNFKPKQLCHCYRCLSIKAKPSENNLLPGSN